MSTGIFSLNASVTFAWTTVPKTLHVGLLKSRSTTNSIGDLRWPSPPVLKKLFVWTMYLQRVSTAIGVLVWWLWGAACVTIILYGKRLKSVATAFSASTFASMTTSREWLTPNASKKLFTLLTVTSTLACVKLTPSIPVICSVNMQAACHQCKRNQPWSVVLFSFQLHVYVDEQIWTSCIHGTSGRRAHVLDDDATHAQFGPSSEASSSHWHLQHHVSHCQRHPYLCHLVQVSEYLHVHHRTSHMQNCQPRHPQPRARKLQLKKTLNRPIHFQNQYNSRLQMHEVVAAMSQIEHPESAWWVNLLGQGFT